MEIVAVADLHGHLPVIEPCDLLVLAGDICPNFSGRASDDQLRQAVWLGSKFRTWLEKVPAARVVAIWGNHDFVGERRQLVPPDLPWTLLQDEAVTIDGLRFYGTPWTPTFFQWAFMRDEEELETSQYAKIPEGLDVLVAHGPPYGYCDQPHATLPRCGSKALLQHVTRANPRLLICGHIHGGRGAGLLPGGGEIYNVALVDEAYKPRPVYSIITIEPRTDVARA